MLPAVTKINPALPRWRSAPLGEDRHVRECCKGKKLQRQFPSHKRTSTSVLNQAVAQSAGDDFERMTHLNVCVLRCLLKQPRGQRFLLTGSYWWSGESSGAINSKKRITENSGCLTSDVWYDIWQVYMSYRVFAFLIMFCFSQYGNELARLRVQAN